MYLGVYIFMYNVEKSFKLRFITEFGNFAHTQNDKFKWFILFLINLYFLSKYV